MAMTSGNGSFGSIESFNSGNTSKLPIALNAYGGNIGIGMTNPGYLLDVNGTLNIRGSFTVNGTAVATGTGSVWTVGASNAIYYSAGNTCLYRNRLVFSNAINDFNHSIFNNSSNWDGEGIIDGFKYNGYNCHWFRVGNAAGAVPTTAMFMNSSGQTVIGNTTDSQSNLLRVFGGNTTSGISLGDYMASTGVKYIGITNVSNGANVAASSGFSGITFGSPYDGGGTSGYLAFHTHGYGISSDERMRIDKGGKIGIGKTNPSQLLDVNGAINCTSFLVNGTAVATGTGSVWGVNGSSAYYTSGNVGISTTAPNANLNVRVGTYSSPVLIVDAGGQGTDITPPRGIGKPLIGVGANSWSNVSSGDYYGIGFGYNANNNAASYYPGEIGFLIQNTGGGEYGDMVFSTRPTTTNTTIASERMRITSAGNIGIGTTSPAGILHINSGTGTLPQLTAWNNQWAVFGGGGSTASAVGIGFCTSASAYWGAGGQLISVTPGTAFNPMNYYALSHSFYCNTDAASAAKVIITSSGSVGIGTTSPAYPLTLKTSANTSGMTHTDGTIIVGSYVGGSVTAGWYGTTSNHPLCFFTNNSAASMTINTSSQVGIGTVTPGYKLQVYSTTANDGILFQNAYNSSTGSIGLFTSSAAGNFILDGTADAGIVLPTAGKDLFLNRTTSLYTSLVVKGGTGNVGIGTATPAYLTSISSSGFINLEINRTSAGTNYGAGIIHSLTSSTGSFRGEYAFAFGGATTIATSAQTQAYGYYGVDLANAGVFGTNTLGYTSSYFFINTSSACFPKTNVGIGKTNPNASYALDVAGSINCTSFLVNGTAVATGTGSVWGVSGSSAYYTSGSVGIGTASPGSSLTIYAGGSAQYLRSSSSVITGCYTEWRDYNATGRFIIGCDGAGLANFELGAGIIGTWSSNSIIFLTNANERMRITSAGNVGIGTISPNTYLCVGPNNGVNQSTNIPGISMTSVSGQNMHFSVGQGTAGTNNVFLKWGYNATTSAGYGSVSCYAGSNPLVLQEGGGNVGIGTVSPATALHIARSVTATADYSLMTYYENTYPAYHDWAIGPYIDGGAAFAIRSGSNNLPANLVNLFFIDGYGTAIRFPGYTTSGTLSINGSGGVISSSSDRRIKQDIVYQTDTADALARVLQLRPATFRFLEQDSVHLGFIAQDVEQCIPLAVDGKKYEWQWIPTENGAPTFDAEGNMLYQTDKDGNKIIRPRGLEDRAIIAMQTLAIQQLAAENSQLKQILDTVLARLTAAGI